ncbi:MAG: 16S rRNA (cytosine(1402)-N(4))-methyltransferase RsmH [Candidatus Levybacteria bacterium]|nr:16S rRNA (cytosine(1402)-N(4))-methyltransferase RsmH [Candidatus Levybacteria bacterium]
MNNYHVSVLLQPTIELLNVRTGRKYIDGTLGGAGHTRLILEAGGEVLGIDHDQEALDFVEKDLGFRIKDLRFGEDIILVKGNFRDIDTIAKANDFENVAGILLDLGISSHHVDSAERGFSFQKEGPLDMRMDQDLSVSATDLVNALNKNELYELFTKLGEEWSARPIIQSIINARQIRRIETTTELSEIIRKAVPWSKKGINPATKVFQALRIAVNDELHSVQDALPKAVNLLESGGRLAVISFHSLEDRIVKRAFLEFEEKGLGKIITKKPVVPTDEEIEINNRSRSSKLRVFEKS